MRKKLVCILMTLCVCILCACGQKKTAEATQTIEFDAKVIYSFGLTSEEFAEDITELGELENVEVVSDREVKIEVTEEQREDLDNAVQNVIQSLCDQFSELHKGCRVEVPEDNTAVDMYIHRTLERKYYDECLQYLVAYNCMSQTLDGKNEYEQNVTFYNSDTGKLIAGANIAEETLEITEEKIANSYILTQEEINALQVSEEVKDIPVCAKIVNGPSTILLLKLASDEVLEYIYCDEDEYVHIGATEEQRKNLVTDFEDHIDTKKEEFKAKKDGYDVVINEDYSEVTLKFDEKLEGQDQKDVVMVFFNICALMQAVKNDGEYYVLINIVDSSSGNTVSTGDTINGIFWNMKDYAEYGKTWYMGEEVK